VLENAASREPATGDSIGGRQLRILWSAYAISSLGSAVSMGAIPLIAVLRLGESAGAVSLMTALVVARRPRRGQPRHQAGRRLAHPVRGRHGVEDAREEQQQRLRADDGRSRRCSSRSTAGSRRFSACATRC
jgi:hypothetical protein